MMSAPPLRRARAAAVTLAAVAVVIAGCAGPSATDRAGREATTRPAAAATPVTAKALAKRVKPSLVVVRYTYDGEVGRRDIEGMGVVVGADGLVVFPTAIVPAGIPDAQMIDFKVIRPHGVEGVDEVEYDATFLGRDERADVAYVRVRAAADDAGDATTRPTWPALEPVDQPTEIGDRIFSVGLLPKGSGYATYVRESTISANLRGPVPLVLTDGRLTAVGSPVFSAAGEMIGFVPEQEGQNPTLNNEEGGTAGLANAPALIVPIRDYLPSLSDPPTALNSRKVPWIGVVQMTGLKKELANYYGLTGKAAVQIGDVIPGQPAARAGLVGGEIVTHVNGQELVRGDVPEELPVILGRQVTRMNVGDDVTLTLLRRQGAEPEQVTLKLTERPTTPNTVDRYYAEDLGYTVRDLVFGDRYSRRLDDTFPGVAVTFVKPQGNAQAGGLQRNDVVTKINQTDVTDVEQFKQAYNDFRKQSPKESIVLEVLRGTDTQIIRIQPTQ